MSARASLVMALMVSCTAARPAPPRPAVPVTAPALAPAAALPPLAAGVFLGTGLAPPIERVECDRGARVCAFADRAGRLAIVERVTGAVLATQAFGEIEAMQFDAAGLQLGVGGHHGAFEWSWRTGEVVALGGGSSYRDGVAINAHHQAWVSGGLGRYQVVVTPRDGGVARTFATDLVKTMRFLADDSLLVVHSDSLELLGLRAGGPITRVASFTLPAEPEPRVRGYAFRPYVHASRSYVWVEASSTQVVLLTRQLAFVRDVPRDREQLVVDPDSDRFVRFQELASGLTRAIVADVDTGRELARAELPFSGGGRAWFVPGGLVFSSRRGRWQWRLGAVPTELPGTTTDVLAVVDGQRIEAADATVQFAPLASPHPTAQAPSYGATFVAGTLELLGDHLVIAAPPFEFGPGLGGPRAEVWSAEGTSSVVAPVPATDVRDAASVTLRDGTPLKLPNQDQAASAWTDATQTRAVVALAEEWRLYDLATGAVLLRVKSPLELGRAPVSFSDDGKLLLVADAHWLVLYDRSGRVHGRFEYDHPDPTVLGLSSDYDALHVQWTPVAVAVAVRDHLWFLSRRDLAGLTRHTLGSDLRHLVRTKSGVLGELDEGVSLFDPRGVLRRQITQAGPRSISSDGTLVAYCDGDRLVVVDELGVRTDGDDTLCARALSVAASVTHLAAMRDGGVDLVRRDDRTRWRLASVASPRRLVHRGRGRGPGEPPPPPEPPERALIVRTDRAFEVWPASASPFVTTVASSYAATPGLLGDLWRPFGAAAPRRPAP